MKNKKSLYWQIPLLVLLIAGTFYIARQNRLERLAEQQQQYAYQHDKGQAFGTFYSVTYQSPANLQSSIDEALALVDGEFSMFNEHSTVAAINRGEDPLRSSMFEEVYRLAQQVTADTDGAFDITVAPLVNAWGFGFKNEQMPTAEQVDSLLKIRSQMDFSAIAKGYGCDMVARALEEHGVTNYMVEIGGEVVTRGVNPRGQQWNIGVSKPSDDAQSGETTELQTILAVSDAAMATSGNYRNFYYKGGRKYAHTIDPRTGYPVQHELLSATVLAPRCAVADAYATAFMVLGLDSARQVLKRHPEMQAYLIYTNAEGHLTEWHSPSLQLQEP
ncbi:MAG: FAD:protein FMN transferase [Prevotella sp.]|nr:FAD:protein FMN transferase [Prevotella sp.]